MKTVLILLLAGTACLVNTLPVDLDHSAQRFQSGGRPDAPSDSGGGGASPPPLPTTDVNKPGEVSSAPDLLGTVIGKDSSVIGKPTPEGDFDIQYRDQSNPVHFKYGECVPFKTKENVPVNFAVFRDPVVCYVYQDEVCARLQHIVPIPLPGSIAVSNTVNLGTILAGSYRCYKFDTAAKNLIGLRGKE